MGRPQADIDAVLRSACRLRVDAGHYEREILRAATHFAAGWLQKLTQIQPLVYRNFRPGSAKTGCEQTQQTA
jgi:hypothetical protein